MYQKKEYNTLRLAANFTSGFGWVIVAVLVFILSSYQLAYSFVTPEELGRVLLKSNYRGITQSYNVYYKDGPTGSTTKGGWHSGIDYRAQSPLNIYSPINGIVDSFDAEGRGYGRVSVKIDGTNDYFIFLHLSKVSIRRGQRIKVGDIIGKTGNTGALPHLHVEVRTGRSNAAYYFKSKDATGANKDPSSVINR